VPVTIGPHTGTVDYGLFIDSSGPASVASPQLGEGIPSELPAAGDVARAIDVVDLEPGTYHVRPWATMGGDSVLGADRTLVVPPLATTTPPPVTTPPPLPPAPPAKAHFKLKASDLSVAKIRHSSRSLTVTVRHLPAGTVMTVQVTIGKRKVTLTRTAGSTATLKLNLKLSKKARTALRSSKVKKLTLKATAKPPGDLASSVTAHPKVRKR
jgi:hypothetical protein